jgi:uncharacterized protein (DUF433 family)
MNLPDFLTRDRYGHIHLAGHRIGLRHVVELYNDGYTPERIPDHFPTLPLALIHKLIAFHLENQAEVDAYVRQSRQALDGGTGFRSSRGRPLAVRYSMRKRPRDGWSRRCRGGPYEAEGIHSSQDRCPVTSSAAAFAVSRGAPR